MSDYLDANARYWAGAYDADHVESFIFRMYGRILKFDYGITGANHERVFDFGCGRAGALNFFDKLGFNCFGVDIAANDIAAAKKRLPHIADQLMVIDPKPVENRIFFDGNFDVVVTVQTLEFLSQTDAKTTIANIYNSMKPGAKIYATWSSYGLYYRNHAEYTQDGLWRVKLKTSRLDYDIYLNLVKDKEDMRERFSMFKPVYEDYYDSSFREEGSEHRLTFFGIKE